MKRFVILAALGTPAVAFAQPAPEMVLMPKALVDAAIALISRDPAVQIRDSFAACVASNTEKPSAHDGCPSVTAALKAKREAEDAEASKPPKNEKPSP